MKAIIPAAGLGTRFLPLTKAQPKEMLPVVNKPTIQWVVEEAVDAGIEDIAIITGKHKKAIENHFRSVKDLEEALEKANQFEELEKIRKATTDTFFLGTSPVLGEAKINYVGEMFDNFLGTLK